ncbi:MAG: diphosphomevalonate decarboxylase [Deltaproteobacteria bacterium]|nr:diphosphomevalonate decarboxylase [Deltaproteobacteria bacterium]
MPKYEASAFAPINIALAKYWGKRDARLNLPTNGSISITLDKFGSTTRVIFDETLEADVLVLNGEEVRTPETLRKISIVLDELRSIASTRFARVPCARWRARVLSQNNFPTAAGLASSASGIAALALAASHALGLKLTPERLSELARRGSGSACRSLFDGFVEWKRGELANGSDSVAASLHPASHWDLRALIVVVDAEPKSRSSTGGMTSARNSSPFFQSWIESAQATLGPIRDAIAARNFHALSRAAEENCLRMHACAISASPSLLYWKPATVALIHEARKMRAEGVEVFFTIDAGPNVVIVATAAHAAAARARLEVFLKNSGAALLETSPGRGAYVL